MTPELNLFVQSLRKNPLAVYFANQVFSTMKEETSVQYSQILRENFERYIELEGIQNAVGADCTEERLFQAVFETFPSFGLLFVIDILGKLKSYKLAKNTLITWILGSTLDHRDFENRESLFLKAYQPEFTEQDCQSVLTQSEDSKQTLAQATYRDFIKLSKQPFPFQPQKDFRLQIEDLFCFAGLSRVFARYFFDMIARAPSDTIATHLAAFFGKLLLIFRLSEISYWKKLGSSEVVKNRLSQMVDLNIRNKRHPVLQKSAFVVINCHHPILHDGRSRGLTQSAHRLFQNQLDTLGKLSIHKTAILANTTLRTNGSEYAVYLLTQLLKSNRETVFQLQEYVSGIQDKQYETFSKLLTSFVNRFQAKSVSGQPQRSKSGRKSGVILSQNTSRLSAAKKKLEKIKTIKGMMTYDKVSAYLEERLKKLYERVKKSGALTHDKIPEYLAQFAAISEPILKPQITSSRQKELVKAFEDSTNEILSIMAEQENLSEEEVAEFRFDIKDQFEELNSPDLEKRTEVVERIGITLADASEKAEKKSEPKDYTKLLEKEEVYIGFSNMAQPMPLLDFLTLPLAERSGPPEDNWFEQHKLYLDLAVQNEKLKQSTVDTVLEAIPSLETPSYKKYFNVFPAGQYEETVICAIYDIWKSAALNNLRMN